MRLWEKDKKHAFLLQEHRKPAIHWWSHTRHSNRFAKKILARILFITSTWSVDESKVRASILLLVGRTLCNASPSRSLHHKQFSYFEPCTVRSHSSCVGRFKHGCKYTPDADWLRPETRLKSLGISVRQIAKRMESRQNLLRFIWKLVQTAIQLIKEFHQ